MKQGIHPQYVETQVVCSCGNTFVTRSTKPTLTIDVCSKCHPYFTGEHRFIDVKGRVEDFQKKQKYAATMKATLASKKSKKKAGTEENAPKTLKELLSEM